MPLLVIRIIFVLLSGVSGYIIVQNVSEMPTATESVQATVLGLAIAVIVIALETILRKYFVDVVAGILFGVTAGFILSYIILQSLNLLVKEHAFIEHFQIPVILMVCYITIAIVLKTKNKFKFIIPYVEFRSSGQVPDYLILDSSSIIDARVFRLFNLDLFKEKILIPQFVLDELQTLSDSSDKLKREKGKKALLTVQKVQEDSVLNFEVYNDPVGGVEGVDAKLIALGKKVNGRVVTTDSNLMRVANIEGVQILNVNTMAEAFRPDVVVGEELEIKIVKAGEKGKKQGVGFLPDGTMVVVENGEERIGDQIRTEVTNFVQTSSGKMIFSKIAE